jgi:hypothetical protein
MSWLATTGLKSVGNIMRAGATAMLFLAMAACAAIPTQPPRFDPYRGLLPNNSQPAAAALRPPIVAAGKSVALVVSSSTEQQFKYIEDAMAVVRTSPGYAYRADMEERGRPSYFVGLILKKFQSKFARVEVVDDFRAATAGKYDYIALIDIGIRRPTSFGVEFAYDINVDLLTPRIERIVSLEGHGVARNSCVGFECGYATDQRALEMAMNQYYASFDAATR